MCKSEIEGGIKRRESLRARVLKSRKNEGQKRFFTRLKIIIRNADLFSVIWIFRHRWWKHWDLQEIGMINFNWNWKWEVEKDFVFQDGLTDMAKKFLQFRFLEQNWHCERKLVAVSKEIQLDSRFLENLWNYFLIFSILFKMSDLECSNNNLIVNFSVHEKLVRFGQKRESNSIKNTLQLKVSRIHKVN